MSSRATPIARLLLVALLPLAAGALAGPRGGGGAPPMPPPQARPAIHQHDNDALSDSVRRIERSTRGQVLSAERVPFDGRDVSRIKTVDAHGRVRVFMDDPQAAPRAPEALPPHPPAD